MEQQDFAAGPSGRRKIRCLIADGHTLVRQGIRRLLEDEPDIEVVQEAATADEALQKLSDHQPDLILMESTMPAMSSLELVRLVQHTSPRTRLIFLTAHDDDDSALLGLRAGVMGYVHKDSPTSSLVQAIRDVHRGIRYVSPQVLHRVRKDSSVLSGNKPAMPHNAILTPREREILKMLAQGNSVKEIAGLLKVSAKTVDAHKFNLMRKLGIHNKAQLVTYAIQKRIVKLAGA